MTASTGVIPWTLTMPAGSLQQWSFTLTVPGSGAPYNITGFAWEYVARVTATDTGSPLVDVTTTPNSQGSIAVVATAALSQVILTLNPAATVALAPGQYAHALWSNPGLSSAFTWVSGSLIIDGTPQP